MESRTFKTVKELKEFMTTLSVNQVKSSIISKTVADNYNIKYKS